MLCFCKQKTAYEVRISDWSSDVCSSDLLVLQTRLLRVLAGGEFYRVGGRELIRCNVRIVAATHQDLAVRVAAGQFRADLMHRLDVVRIEQIGRASWSERVRQYG